MHETKVPCLTPSFHTSGFFHPYEDWLYTVVANATINWWVVNVHNQDQRTQLDQLRLNRNVRSHLHQYGDDDIEEILYCEWPELLMEMVKALHAEGEL
jgi:hypothetical protein